jgi:hypothetical protein
VKRIAAVALAALLLTGCAASPQDSHSYGWSVSYFDCLDTAEVSGQLEEEGVTEMERRCALFADKNEGVTTVDRSN